jgi:NAD(P)-dependent dehydrogenase (short-subunit alcohol dehydrogenase family)
VPAGEPPAYAIERRASGEEGAGRAGGLQGAGTVPEVTLVVLTGATRGIGRAAAIEFARQGAEVVLVGRDHDRVTAVAREVVAASAGGPVHERVADLTLTSEVRALAEELRGRYERIDVLANNAGALLASRRETSEGSSRPSR